MKAEYATITVELDGFPQSTQDVPEQWVPRRYSYSNRCERE